MLEISDLPTVNATLNTISGILLTIGYVQIRQRKITAHKKCMLAALVCLCFFWSATLSITKRWVKAVYKAGMDSSCLLYDSDFTHYFGIRHCAVGVADALFGVARTV